MMATMAPDMQLPTNGNGGCPITGRNAAIPPLVNGCPIPGQIEELASLIPYVEPPTTPEGRWEPQKLMPRHREIMRRILEGGNYTQIAEQMGISYQAVMLICTSKLFREELQKLEDKLDTGIIKRADDLSGEALDTIKTAMRFAKSDALKLRAAERILDTAGYSKVEKKLVGVVSGEDVIKELNRMRRERPDGLKSHMESATSNGAIHIGQPEVLTDG